MEVERIGLFDMDHSLFFDARLTFGCNGHLTPGEICYRKFRPASNAADLGRYTFKSDTKSVS
jgi:hypothetical protein